MLLKRTNKIRAKQAISTPINEPLRQSTKYSIKSDLFTLKYHESWSSQSWPHVPGEVHFQDCEEDAHDQGVDKERVHLNIQWGPAGQVPVEQ